MATLKEEAQAYMPKQTKNIAELDKVAVSMELFTAKAKTKEGEEFEYKYIKVNDEEYRVPESVLKGIKAILNKMPKCEYISVIKSGSGMGTEYQVIPYTS